MKEIYPLTALKPEEWGVIKAITAGSDIRRRLRDLGMIEGTKVECVFKSPGKDPVAYYVRGAVIALRNEDSDCIMISYM